MAPAASAGRLMGGGTIAGSRPDDERSDLLDLGAMAAHARGDGLRYPRRSRTCHARRRDPLREEQRPASARVPAHRHTAGRTSRRGNDAALPVPRGTAGRRDACRHRLSAALAVGTGARRERASRRDRQRDGVRARVAPRHRADGDGSGPARARARAHRERGARGDDVAHRGARAGRLGTPAPRLAVSQRVPHRRPGRGVGAGDVGPSLGGQARRRRRQHLQRSRHPGGLDAWLGGSHRVCRGAGLVACRARTGRRRDRLCRRERRAAEPVRRAPPPGRGLPRRAFRPARARRAAHRAPRPLRCRHGAPAASLRRSLLLLHLHARRSAGQHDRVHGGVPAGGSRRPRRDRRQSRQSVRRRVPSRVARCAGSGATRARGRRSRSRQPVVAHADPARPGRARRRAPRARRCARAGTRSRRRSGRTRPRSSVRRSGGTLPPGVRSSARSARRRSIAGSRADAVSAAIR